MNSTFIRPSSPIWSALNLNGGTCERRSNLIIPLTFRRYQHSLSLSLAKSAAVRANSYDYELASQRPMSGRGSLHIPHSLCRLQSLCFSLAFQLVYSVFARSLDLFSLFERHPAPPAVKSRLYVLHFPSPAPLLSLVQNAAVAFATH